MAINSDLYNIQDFMSNIASRFVDDVSEDALVMGTFGYMGEQGSIAMQNAIVMASEYSNEGIPVKAKFEKNVITHALSLGINKINATPASMNVLISLPETAVVANMINDKFTFDKDIKIFFGNYEFHTDYDIIISKTVLMNNEIVYTAMYDMSRKNTISTLSSPYLMSIARVNSAANGQSLLVIRTTIHQIEESTVYKKIMTDNPIENKTINFEFESALAAFEVEVREANATYYLTPVYDGLIDQNADYYCNYTYMNENSIRVKFNRDSYEPRVNCDVIIHIKTTQGSSGNFEYSEDVVVNMSSERFSYEGMFASVKPASQSLNGEDKKSVAALKKLIPVEALSRGSITNLTDLQSYFNSINNDNGKVYFYKKRENQFERLYYAYVVLKDDLNVIPTNTVQIRAQESDFNSVTEDSYQLNPGNFIRYTSAGYGTILNKATAPANTDPNTIFDYMNPFMCILNKETFYISYFLTFLDTTNVLNFDYINQNSNLQIISTAINSYRNYFTDKNLFKIDMTITQNIGSDFGIISKNIDGTLNYDNIKIIGLIYNNETDVDPIRYAEGEVVDFDLNTFDGKIRFNLETDDVMDRNNHIKVKNIHDIRTGIVSDGYLASNIRFKICIFIKLNTEYGRKDYDSLIPGLEGFTLCNEYTAVGGISIFYDYTDIVNSPVQLSETAEGNDLFIINRVPLIKDAYVNTEKKLKAFITQLEERRKYIEDSVKLLEDNFGVDFKFFNTYGPSKIFKVSDYSNINRVNLSLTFRMKPVTTSDAIIRNNIIKYIKDYMEDLNEISDLHMSNLTTEIETKYADQIVYFEFVDINGYGPGYQHVYRIENEDYLSQVPEFLNINTLNDGTPDINIIVV